MAVNPDAPVDAGLMAILQQARTGDDASRDALLASLYIPARRYLVRLISRTGEPYDLADDLAQETIIRILQRLQQCTATSDAQLLAWTLAIARNRLIDHLRQSRAVPMARFHEDLPGTHHLVRDDACLWERAVSTLMNRLMKNLPEETVLLLQMRADPHRRWADIAEGLSTTPSAAKRRFQRAQARMQRQLEDSVRALPPAMQRVVRLRLRSLLRKA